MQEAVTQWGQAFKKWHGRELPKNYLVFDCETTGFSREWDLPIDIGHVVVRDGHCVHSGNHVLNWVGYPGVETKWLSSKMTRIRRDMAKEGKTFAYDIERLRTDGKPPAQVLQFYYKLFDTNRRAGAHFVTHGGFLYDSEMISTTLLEACGLHWEFDPNELYDTGCMEKAVIAEIIPFPDDSNLREYFRRVFNAGKKGRRWNIETCVERYNMHERFGIDPRSMHNPAIDAMAAYLLFEEHRRCQMG